MAASGSIVGRARSTVSFTRFVTSESPNVTTIRNGGMNAAGDARPLDRADHDADQEDARGRCQVRDLQEDAMGRLGAVRLGPSSRRGVDAGERVGPADSDREDADDRPREHGRRQRQRQREAGEDIRIEPAPDEPAGGRVLADLRRDGGGRGTAPPRAKRRAGASPRGEARPLSRPVSGRSPAHEPVCPRRDPGKLA